MVAQASLSSDSGLPVARLAENITSSGYASTAVLTATLMIIALSIWMTRRPQA